jgi:Secretion system C-terminal sorting domain
MLGMSQGWQHFMGGAGDQRGFSVRVAPDGRIAVLGSSADTVGGKTDWYFFTTDSLGQTIGEYSWGVPDTSEYGLSIMRADSQFLLLGNAALPEHFPNSTQPKNLVEWKLIDDQANILASGVEDNNNRVARGGLPFNGGYLVFGAEYWALVDSYFPASYCRFIETSGALGWKKLFQDAEFSEAVAAVAIAPQEVVLLGKVYNTATLYDFNLYRLNGSGAIQQSNGFISPLNIKPEKLLQLADNSLMVIGSVGNTFVDQDIFLSKVNPITLDTIWWRRIQLPGSQGPHAAMVLPNGNLVIAGENIPENSSSRDAFLAVTNPQGQVLWFRTYGGLRGDIFWDIQAAADGNGFVIAGQTASFNQEGDLQAWLLRTDSLGGVWSNRVMGRVVRDAIQNCLVDASETPLANWLVTASGAASALFTLSDSMGEYSMGLDTGTWFISCLPPSGYWNTCEDSVEVYYGQFGDTLSVDFPTQVLYDCPQLDVDLTTPYLRRCFENPNYVRYFNYGTSTAPNAQVSIELDPYLSINGSSIPYTQTGNTVYFDVGAVPWLSGGAFSFTTLVDCDSTVLGQLHCLEAHITPDSICTQFSPEWDGSNLEVSGYCAGDSVVFVVTNTGSGMNGPVSYIITEDQIIFKLSTLQLDQGQDTSFVLYPNGATATIVVTQSPGHPGNSQPILVIEGCGGGAFSTGYAFQFPQNDGDPSIDIECRPNIGSFDPNDKVGLPLGVSDAGVIKPETKIEYLIRFQNTGTDTAFRVELRDTLSAMLDLATFKEGASSHPYRLKISGQGVLHFLFDPILLPDSTANWSASQGFVKFSILPKKTVPPGTKIKNSAAIYFDSNPAVNTNTTLHTIDNPLSFLHTQTTQQPGAVKGALTRILATPNPTNGRIWIKLQQPLNSGRLHVETFDLLGKRQHCNIEWPKPAAQALELDLSDLPAGMYIVLIKDVRGTIVARGRVIKL